MLIKPLKQLEKLLITGLVLLLVVGLLASTAGQGQLAGLFVFALAGLLLLPFLLKYLFRLLAVLLGMSLMLFVLAAVVARLERTTDQFTFLAGCALVSFAAYLLLEHRRKSAQPTRRLAGAERTPVLPATELNE